MISQNVNATFSANVKLHLYIGQIQIELGQVGPDFAILRTTQSIDASEGELETIVDDKVTRHRIRFTSPITANSRRFTFETVGQA